MSSERRQLEATIEGLEAQRALLGDVLVDEALAPLRARLAALEAQFGEAPPTQALRQVTVLFLDIVGSTALSQHLDPEEIHAVLDGALLRCTRIVEAHHGKVLQYAGDNLLAVFGADQSREDDAERAVRCGLALLAEGRALGAEVRHRHGRDGFDVRVGLHTGGVLLGGGVDAEGSIRGIAVNVAARMEQTAPAGALRISHATYRQLRGGFDVEPEGRIAVKGLDEPVATYLVRRAKGRSFRMASRGVEGVESRMVGREAEFESLQNAFTDLVSKQRFAIVTVVGEAGMGKSRLLYEFERWTKTRPEDFQIFVGRAYPSTQSEPYGLLRDILASRLQIADSDSMNAAKQKFEAEFASQFEAEDGADAAQAHAHLLGHLVGLDFSASRHVSGIKDDPRQIRNRAFHAAAQLFRRVAIRSGTPVVLVLEDMHWADDDTLDFIDYVAKADHDVPMLILGLTRPALFERRRDWDRADRKRIELSALDQDSSEQLAGELLQRLASVPTALSELILGRAGGNPFYMEELVKMLLDQGAIETAGGHWTVRSENLPATQVPSSLTGVLQARLDSLPQHERLALQEASVIGLVFWDQALKALDDRAPEALPALVQRALALPLSETTVEDMHEFAFSHQILHQVTYDTLLKRTRRELHARAAAWLAGRTGARAGDLLGATAEHYAQAGDSLHACEFFARAAEYAKSRYAHDAALGHVARALALLEQAAVGESADRDARGELPNTFPLRWRLLVVRENILGLQGKRSEQRIALDAMQWVADALGDDRRRALVARRRSMLGLRTADHAAQESAAREAVTLAERVGDVEQRLEAQRLLADALGAQGDLVASQALARDGLAEARARGLRRVEGTFLNALSYIASLQDDQVAGLELDQQDLPIWRELGDRIGESIALGNIGADWLWFGEYKQARHNLEDALKVCRAIGGRQMELGPLCNLSQLALWEGNVIEALAQAREALELAVSVQASDYEAEARYRLGEAELALGHHAAAAESFERAKALAQGVGHGIQYDATCGRAKVALAVNDVAAALVAVEGLLDHRARGGSLDGADPRLLLFTCHKVLARAGDPRAPELLDSAYADLQNRAGTIADAALRQSFLTNVPHHREIVSAWAMHQAASSSAN